MKRERSRLTTLLQAARNGDLLASIIDMLRSVILLSAAALSCLSSAGCSSDEAEAPRTRTGEIRANETWTNGLELTGTIKIIGATVDIEPGATIKCSKGTQIQVGGVLRKAAGARAKITCSEWDGIIVAQGGKVELEEIDLESPLTGVRTTPGAAESSLKKVSITKSVKPFTVDKDSKLVIDDVKATTPKEVPADVQSIAEIRGLLIASRLDYDAQTNEGLRIADGGSAEIVDSFIHGTGGLDMVASYAGKSLKLSYSKLSGAHCGPHMQGIETFEIDHIVSEGNTYGITIYEAGAGPLVVKDSNIDGVAAWLDLKGPHGPITFDNVFTGGANTLIVDTDPPTIKEAAAAIPGAGPR
jgi:hypothetical protein